MNKTHLLAIDQGTTGTRALVFDKKARLVVSSYQEYQQIYPQPGWVEHDPDEIWKTTQRVISKALQKKKISSNRIASIGITNQRETTILWSRRTGKPFANAIVWQDRRTSDLCLKLKKLGKEPLVRKKTGLVLDPYFSATKIQWLFNKYPRIRRAAKTGDVLFGTIDSWLLWKLTGGNEHATDYSNASRTLLFNIRSKKWDSELLKLFKVPANILPQVKSSGSLFGKTVKQGALEAGIPIHAMIGDQQAALYGQACYRKGQVKNTYGTGCFIVQNLGKKLGRIPSGLIATLACDQLGQPCYALEGSIFITGAAVQWLRDGLQLFENAGQTDEMIQSLKDSGGVTFVPAFAGLGSPHWNPYVRGMMVGITSGTKREHIIRATLESIAHQSADVLEAMERYSGIKIKALKVDGGGTANRFMMQFQANMLGTSVLVSDMKESTAWGAAKLAGHVSGFWPQLDQLDRQRRYKHYRSKLAKKKANEARFKWKNVVQFLVEGNVVNQ